MYDAEADIQNTGNSIQFSDKAPPENRAALDGDYYATIQVNWFEEPRVSDGERQFRRTPNLIVTRTRGTGHLQNIWHREDILKFPLMSLFRIKEKSAPHGS